jgi:hypothetical protein
LEMVSGRRWISNLAHSAPNAWCVGRSSTTIYPWFGGLTNSLMIGRSRTIVPAIGPRSFLYPSHSHLISWRRDVKWSIVWTRHTPILMLRQCQVWMSCHPSPVPPKWLSLIWHEFPFCLLFPIHNNGGNLASFANSFDHSTHLCCYSATLWRVVASSFELSVELIQH